jgi:hypothetical protein
VWRCCVISFGLDRHHPHRPRRLDRVAQRAVVLAMERLQAAIKNLENAISKSRKKGAPDAVATLNRKLSEIHSIFVGVYMEVSRMTLTIVVRN